MLPELLVKLIEVSDKVTCASGCEVTLGMNSNVRVVALVGEEGRNASRSTGRVVVSELGKWQEFGPVVLLVIAVDSEVLFQSLVRSFSLAVPFRMITRGEVQLHV